jgi:hypothetical protein
VAEATGRPSLETFPSIPPARASRSSNAFLQHQVVQLGRDVAVLAGDQIETLAGGHRLEAEIAPLVADRDRRRFRSDPGDGAGIVDERHVYAGVRQAGVVFVEHPAESRHQRLDDDRLVDRRVRIVCAVN